MLAYIYQVELDFRCGVFACKFVPHRVSIIAHISPLSCKNQNLTVCLHEVAFCFLRQFSLG